MDSKTKISNDVKILLARELSANDISCLLESKVTPRTIRKARANIRHQGTGETVGQDAMNRLTDVITECEEKGKANWDAEHDDGVVENMKPKYPGYVSQLLDSAGAMERTHALNEKRCRQAAIDNWYKTDGLVLKSLELEQQCFAEEDSILREWNSQRRQAAVEMSDAELVAWKLGYDEVDEKLREIKVKLEHQKQETSGLLMQLAECRRQGSVYGIHGIFNKHDKTRVSLEAGRRRRYASKKAAQAAVKDNDAAVQDALLDENVKRTIGMVVEMIRSYGSALEETLV